MSAYPTGEIIRSGDRVRFDGTRTGVVEWSRDEHIVVRSTDRREPAHFLLPADLSLITRKANR